ncbi:MAG TPA: TIGR04255 family protein [Terriglobia bacterium]|nr:TIGR04255 family protein [Terriglobia bacterium]
MSSPVTVTEIFPRSEKVLYDRPTLASVVCQVEFPAILKISTELPSAFQELIRDDYPVLSTRQEIPLLPSGLPPEIMEVVKRSFASQKANGYEFVSADSLWRVSLTNSSLALITANYKRFEDFLAHFHKVIAALRHVYKPAFFPRVSLRYQNVVQRTKLQIPVTTPWTDLLRPHIAGIMGTGVAEAVESLAGQAVIALGSYSAKVLVNVALGEVVGTKEKVFVLDSYFHTTTGRVSNEDVASVLQYFNQESARFFRWCISDDLHRAMGPRPIDISD